MARDLNHQWAVKFSQQSQIDYRLANEIFQAIQPSRPQGMTLTGSASTYWAVVVSFSLQSIEKALKALVFHVEGFSNPVLTHDIATFIRRRRRKTKQYIEQYGLLSSQQWEDCIEVLGYAPTKDETLPNSEYPFFDRGTQAVRLPSDYFASRQPQVAKAKRAAGLLVDKISKFIRASEWAP